MSSWWSSDRIAATVTESYISRKIPDSKQAILHSPLGFGTGLTDATYIDWILAKAPRFFLILDDIGNLDYIFKIVDQSFVDEDLPLSPNVVSELGLTGASGKKFVKRQYAFLVKELCEGSHVDYGDEDIIPVNQLLRKQSSLLGANVDKVQVGDRTFLRRRLRLDEESGLDRGNFVVHFKGLQKLRHPHVTSVWATYTHQDNGYILLQPSTDMTLKAFFEDPPKHFKTLSKPEQRDIAIRWIQCLTNGLAFLHANGHAHQAIRPSNIFIDSKYNIFLGAYGSLGALEDIETSFQRDSYNHGSPEQWQKKATFAETNPLRSTLPGGGRTGRRVKPPKSSSLTPESNAVALPQDEEQQPRATSRSSHYPESSTSNSLARRLSTLSSASTDNTSSSTSEERRQSRRNRAIVATLTYSQPNPAKTQFDASPFFPSDVFSICTIITSLLSLLASVSKSASKLSPSNIPSHLSKRNRMAGRGGAPADTSWHANLLQVSAWLDELDHSVEEKKERKLSLSRKDKGESENDTESWRWKGFLTKMTDMMRYGFQKDTKIRWTAEDGVQKIGEQITKWGINTAKCCEGMHGRIQTPEPLIRRSSVLRRQALRAERERNEQSVTSVKSANINHIVRSPIRDQKRPTSVIPEEVPSPGLPELSGEPRSPPPSASPVVKIDSPSMPELPASEADAYSPRRIDFKLPPPDTYMSPSEQVVSPLTPADQGWDFDFPTNRSYSQARDTNGIESDYEESVGDDIEELIQNGFDAAWPSHISSSSVSSSPIPYQNRKLPPTPGMRSSVKYGRPSSSRAINPPVQRYF